MKARRFTLGLITLLVALWLPWLPLAWSADDPPDEDQAPRREAPALPPGLGGGQGPPPLPAGLSDETGPESETKESDTDEPDFQSPAALTGFWELRGGVRITDDPRQRATSIAETRLQLSGDRTLGPALVRVTADLVYDNVAGTGAPNLERGSGVVDLREAYIGMPVGESADLRAGRQVLTWGVGDLLFLNDLFPKDWNSFFVGRDVEYLKAPSDALRLGVFSSVLNIDLVYTPRFDTDRFVDNRRLSFFDPRVGRLVGRDVHFRPVFPDDPFDDHEIALRLHRTVGGWELATYGYRGFWKSPAGLDAESGRPLFPRLSVWGGSLRGPLHSGILSAETAWYRSRDDLSGRDPRLPNSQFRLLLGYEQELIPNLTLGGQYYLERTLDYGALERGLPASAPRPDRNRQVLTLRATLLTHRQTVRWSLFTFASPTDDDLYLRGLWAWDVTDDWTVSAGLNLFQGRRDDSFFGQFESNSNLYFGLRRGF